MSDGRSGVTGSVIGAFAVIVAALVTGYFSIRDSGSNDLIAKRGISTISEFPQIWEVHEGIEKNVEGRWEVNGYGEEFDCNLKRNSSELITSKCIVIRDEGFIAIKRDRSNEDSDCHYFGQQTRSTIKGKLYCRRAGESDFSINILKK